MDRERLAEVTEMKVGRGVCPNLNLAMKSFTKELKKQIRKTFLQSGATTCLSSQPPVL